MPRNYRPHNRTVGNRPDDGGRYRVADAKRVGNCEVTVPKPEPKGVPQVSVTFHIDASGAFRLPPPT